MSKPTMNTQDAVSANFAECFVTIDGTRYSMLMAKEFEGTASSTPLRFTSWAVLWWATRPRPLPCLSP